MAKRLCKSRAPTREGCPLGLNWHVGTLARTDFPDKLVHDRRLGQGVDLFLFFMECKRFWFPRDKANLVRSMTVVKLYVVHFFKSWCPATSTLRASAACVKARSNALLSEYLYSQSLSTSLSHEPIQVSSYRTELHSISSVHSLRVGAHATWTRKLASAKIRGPIKIHVLSCKGKASTWRRDWVDINNSDTQQDTRRAVSVFPSCPAPHSAPSLERPRINPQPSFSSHALIHLSTSSVRKPESLSLR